MSSVTDAARPPLNRQAIVIIHGIGEQRPLGTLKSFVRSFRTEGTFYSKPERLTDSFEARRMKLRKLEKQEETEKGHNWIETDFYEYYWAHMMFGERWRHLVFWARRVLRCAWRAGDTRGAERRMHNGRVLSARRWVVASLAALMLIGAVLLGILGPLAIVVIAVAIVALLALLDWAFDRILLRVVGDVSRYLDVAPQNIARRHAILQGGIELLRALHAERSDLAEGEPANAPFVYDRIVVVGHSLGSVIGYELIKHYWARVNRYLTIDKDDIPESLTSLESASPSAGAPANYQQLQFELWKELGRKFDKDPQRLRHALVPPRWLVTDFVTLGSPLTYGAILQAESAADFSEKTALRELPTCPPNRSLRDRPGGFAVHLFYEAAGYDEHNSPLILHHAAPFALTRWTNIYYEADPVGGRLANVFGNGIRDIGVVAAKLFGDQHRLNGLELHTRYWPPFDKYIPELLEILRWRPHGG